MHTVQVTLGWGMNVYACQSPGSTFSLPVCLLKPNNTLCKYVDTMAVSVLLTCNGSRVSRTSLRKEKKEEEIPNLLLSLTLSLTKGLANTFYEYWRSFTREESLGISFFRVCNFSFSLLRLSKFWGILHPVSLSTEYFTVRFSPLVALSFLFFSLFSAPLESSLISFPARVHFLCNRHKDTLAV